MAAFSTIGISPIQTYLTPSSELKPASRFVNADTRCQRNDARRCSPKFRNGAGDIVEREEAADLKWQSCDLDGVGDSEARQGTTPLDL